MQSSDHRLNKAERETQNRVIKLFTERLGYRYLGDKTDTDNSCIEEAVLIAWLEKRGYDQQHINRAVEHASIYAQLEHCAIASWEPSQANLTHYVADLR